MKNHLKVLFTSVIFLLISNISSQIENISIAPASHIGGNMDAAAFTENYGYLSQGGYLTILDLSTDPFTQIAYLDLKGEPNDMEVKDGLLYLIGSDLLIYDLANEIQPELQGELELGTTTEPQLHISNNTLYSVSNDEGLRIIDVSDSTQPELINHFSDGSDFGDVVVVDDYAYILDNNYSTLRILDISDPQNLVETGQVNVQTGPNSLFIDKDIAYVTVNSYPDIGMRVFDLHDKTNPLEIGYIETKTVDGNVTHYDTPKKVIVENNYAYVACSSESSLYVIDVEDPSTPIEFSRFGMQPIWEGGPIAMQKMGNDIYMSYRWSGKSVRKINAADPSLLELENLYESPYDVLWLQSGMDYLYLADQSRLWIYDMSDLYNPVPASNYSEWNLINRMCLNNNILYCARRDSLFILDVSNPLTVTQLSFLNLGSWPSEMMFQDGNLFVLLDKNPGTVKVFDMSDPFNPAELTSFDLSGIGHGLYYDEANQLFSAGVFKNPDDYGFDLYDLSSISSPTLLTTVQTASAPNAIAIDGNHLFFAGNRDNGGTDQWHIEAYDISDPQNPVLEDQLATNGQIWDMEMRDGAIFAGVPGNTIFIILFIDGHLIIIAECPSETTREISTSPVNMNTYTGYGASLDGDGYSYPSGKKDLSGTDGVPVQIIIWPPPQECCIKTAVRPEIAATPTEPYECKSIPGCTTGNCGSGAEVKATPGPEWVFTHWSGAANGTSPTTNASITGMTGCPDCPDNVAYAHFTPWLKNSGGGSLWDCPFEAEDEIVAMLFNLEASKADAWIVDKIDVKISGDEDLSQYIKKAKLKWTGEEEKEHSGNGTISFNTAGLSLEPGKGQEFTLYLTFEAMTDLKCPAEPKEIIIQVETSGVDGNAVTYGPGRVIGQSTGTFSVSCVRNITQNENYETITEAEEAASENEEIWVCPGDYEENIQVEKENLKIYAPEGPNKTYVLAKENNQPGFQLKANGITIEGFGIRNATESYGIYVNGSTIKNSALLNNRLTNNKHGISLQDAENTFIDKCSGFENLESGLHVINSIKTTVNSSSFYKNKQNGIYFMDCAGSLQMISGINESACRENNMNGIYLKNSQYIYVDYNTAFSKNDSCGIDVDECESIIIRDNPFIDENKNGIRVTNSKKTTIEGNKINENQEKGIIIKDCLLAESGDANNIHKNVIVGNRPSSKQKHGIFVSNSKYTIIGKSSGINEIRSHKISGISIVEGGKNRIEGDSIFWNDGYGIYIENSCGNIISGPNKVGPENGDGIKLSNCKCSATDRNEIKKARIIANKKNGVVLSSSYGNLVGIGSFGNTISNNDESGIDLVLSKCPQEQINQIEGNKIYDNKHHGIHMEQSEFNGISKNEIWSNQKDGIHIRLESSLNGIEENTISGNKKQSNGIVVDGSGRNTLDNNKIESHLEAGIKIVDLDGSVSITNNTIKSNNYGIHAQNSTAVSVGDFGGLSGPNTFSSNTEAGIYIESCKGNDELQIVHNNFENEKTGILAEKSEGMLINDNTLIKNNETAIKVLDCSADFNKSIEISNNQVFNCLAHGIVLEKSTGVVVGGDVIAKSNQIKGNKGNGIHVFNCKPENGNNAYINLIQKNTVYDKNKNGIYLKNCQYNDVFENACDKNSKDGIRLSESIWNRIRNNTCRENEGNGVALNQSEQNFLLTNEALRNGESGIFLNKSNYNRIWDSKHELASILENEDHGIRIDDSYENTVRDQLIKSNKKHGIVINEGGQNKIYGPIQILENTKDGIQLNKTNHNKIFGAISGKAIGSGIAITYDFLVRKNGSQGIHLKKSHANSFNNLKIVRHTTGLLLEHSNRNVFDIGVRILLNGVGGRGVCSYGSNYGKCAYSHNVVTTEIVGCSVVPSFYEGCHFLDSETDAFTLSNGAKPTFRNCNFIDVGDMAIDNQNDTVSIDARHNWWGDPSGPGGAGPGNGVKVGENVDFEPWLTAPVSLQAAFIKDTFYLQTNRVDSIYYKVLNFLNPGDSVAVSIYDTLTWNIFNQDFEVALYDSLGYDSIIHFTYDPSLHLGEVNKVILDCESLVYEDQRAKDSVYLITYEPVLSEILLFPDSLTLTVGDSWLFQPILMDQHRNYIESDLLWWSEGPFINEEGLFTAVEEGFWNVWVTDIDQLNTAMVRVFVNALPELTDISIRPEMAELSLDDTLRFEADGWDQFGEAFYFRPIWSTDGGAVDPYGLYTASEIGDFSVTAYNSDSTLWKSATVIVIFVNTTDSNDTGDNFTLHSVYPQPCTDQAKFNFELKSRSILALNIYDQLGRKQLVINELWYPSGNYELRVNTGTFPSGTYYYEILVNDEKKTGKLIKL